jgi:hypothetical protein
MTTPIDTSPAALIQAADGLHDPHFGLDYVEIVLRTVAAEKEAQPPVADVPFPSPDCIDHYDGQCAWSKEQMHQYAEAYANAKVAAERERCANLCKEIAARKGEKFFGQVVSDGSAAQCERAIRAAQKGTT